MIFVVAEPTRTIVSTNILWCSRVAALAILSPRSECCRPPIVFALGNGFQVFGVTAKALPTKVVDVQAVGDRAVPQFVGRAMHSDVAEARNSPSRIAPFCRGQFPDPARR